MSKKQCTSCGKNTTTLCMLTKTRRKASIWGKISPTIKLFPLGGLGPTYVLKSRQKSFQTALANLVRTLNRYSPRQGPKSFGKLAKLMHSRALLLHAFMIKNHALHPSHIVKYLKDFVPTHFLCTVNNWEKFRNIVQLSCTCSQGEQIFEEDLIHGFQLDVIEWLPQDINKCTQKSLFRDAIKFVLFHIILPLLHKLFTFIPLKSYEMVAVVKTAYQRVVYKLVRHLEKNGTIEAANESKHQFHRKHAAYLSFKPKYDSIDNIDRSSFRIIALFPKRNDNDNHQRNLINKKLQELASHVTFVKCKNFFEEWCTYATKHKDKQLFILTIDITDCFGNIHKETLKSQICSSVLPDSYKHKLIDAISNQYIMFGQRKGVPNLWKWNHGLLQGMKFSNALCEFYLSNVEARCFKEFNRTECFLHRKVDDYFFASTKRKDLFEYLKIAEESFNINNSKTQSNIIGNRAASIHFCGMEISTKTFRIKCAFTDKTEMYKRFRFWNKANPKPKHAMLDSAVNYSYNNFYFQPAFMNVAFNGVSHVLQNFFESMIFLALKLDASIMSATCGSVKRCHEQKIMDVIMNSIKYYTKHVLHTNVQQSGTIPLLKQKLYLLALRAFELVFKKRPIEVYYSIFKMLQEDLRERTKSSAGLTLFISCYRTIPGVLQTISIQFSLLNRPILKSICFRNLSVHPSL